MNGCVYSLSFGFVCGAERLAQTALIGFACDPPCRVAGVLQSLEKIDDRVVLHMQPTKLSIMARSDVELGLQAYCALMAVRFVPTVLFAPERFFVQPSLVLIFAYF